jgi:hypothetical protein
MAVQHKFTDPGGHVAFLVVTGAVGFIGGGIYGAYSSMHNDGAFSLSKTLAYAGVGGLAGLTLGAGTSLALTGTAFASTEVVGVAAASVAAPALTWLQTKFGRVEETAKVVQQQIAGFQVTGSQELVGKTYQVNIQGLYRVGGASTNIRQLFQLVDALKQQAISAGASSIRIVGEYVINPGISNMSQETADLIGMTVQRINNTTIVLQGPLF